MSIKDERILSLDGGRYPFQVSDEYFDNLTARIMERIPEEGGEEVSPESAGREEATALTPKIVSIGQKGRRHLWIRAISIAASLVLLAVVTLKLVPTSTPNASVDEQTAEYTEDDYNEDLMTYAMADNMAVYGYLSGYVE